MQLTDTMILVRAKHSSLSTIRELNLCGYNLSDVWAVSRLTNIQVLALSVNNISSLEPFQECRSLRELYLRRNGIADIRELFYLRNLPFLRSLWLKENPFCMQLGQSYRAAVLNILPNLQVLDDISVTRDELEQAKLFQSPYNDEIGFGMEKLQNAPAIMDKPCINDLGGQESSNVLSAIISLVKELDLSGLEALQSNIVDRIKNFCGEKH